MAFTSVAFLFGFLPALLAAYLLAPGRWRNPLLVVASLAFYVWGAGDFVFLLLASTLADYALGLAIDSTRRHRRTHLGRALLALSVIQNLGLLGWFKYAGFLAEQANAVLGLFGRGAVPVPELLLPIGVSFFVFEKISYAADVHAGRCPVEPRVVDFLLFVTLFPRSIAGPIVRYADIAAQLRDHPTTLESFSDGALRFALGLAKKTIVADGVAPIADAAFATSAAEMTTAVAWLGAVAFGIQIYFDFSGYSDMAIGLGRMLGFRLPENFRRPYSSISVTDFWRRWHVTLSSWFRDYLYLPLGGSHRGEARVLANLVIVFLATGLWHGAKWTFVVWGAYHGALLLIERALGLRAVAGVVRFPAIRRAATLAAVTIGWVPFRATDLAQAFTFLEAMLLPRLGAPPAAVAYALTSKAAALLAAASLVAVLPREFSGARFVAAPGPWPALARAVLVGVALPYAAVRVAAVGFSPFLYFQF